jgi:hypothetical protein
VFEHSGNEGEGILCLLCGGGGVDLVSRTCLILRFDIFGGKVKGMAQQMMEQGMCLISYFLSGLFSETARFCISRC